MNEHDRMSLCHLVGIPFENGHERLLAVVLECHRSSALNNQNASSVALSLAASSGARFEHSLASALLTCGVKHAPVAEARDLIFSTTLDDIDAMIDAGKIIPGWGNSFFKQSIDPSWAPASHFLKENHGAVHEKIDAISERIFKGTGRVIYPNAAAFTAASCEILGIPRGVESHLFVVGRMAAWASQFLAQVKS